MFALQMRVGCLRTCGDVQRCRAGAERERKHAARLAGLRGERRAGAEQQAQDADVAQGGGKVQRSEAVDRRNVDLGAVRQQQRDHSAVRRAVQGGEALGSALGIHQSTEFKKASNQLGIYFFEMNSSL